MFSEKSEPGFTLEDLKLKILTGQQVEQIDRLISLLGDQGEVHLIVQRGILKYINKVEKNTPWEQGPQK